MIVEFLEFTKLRLGYPNTPYAGKVTLEQADIQALQFESDSFDRFFANLCIMLVPDADKAMREACRGWVVSVIGLCAVQIHQLLNLDAHMRCVCGLRQC